MKALESTLSNLIFLSKNISECSSFDLCNLSEVMLHPLFEHVPLKYVISINQMILPSRLHNQEGYTFRHQIFAQNLEVL